MKFQILFSGKDKKNIPTLLSAALAGRVVKFIDPDRLTNGAEIDPSDFYLIYLPRPLSKCLI